MAYSCIFKRREMKYLLTAEQKSELLAASAGRLVPDCYGKSLICNVYYDTEDFRLIRASLRKPVYKEKLRVRSYGRANSDSTVFLELKKKYKGIVYKRRVPMSLKGFYSYMESGERTADGFGQIYDELDTFMEHYNPVPAAFISYNRTALVSAADPGFRVTFDTDISGRTTGLDLKERLGGDSLLPVGKELMEVKVSGGMPMWFADALCKAGIYQESFSKYGEFYLTRIMTGGDSAGIA